VKKTYVVLKEGVRGPEQLSEYMEEEQILPFKESEIPIRFIIIPDYSETESVVILKISHILLDG